MSGIHSMPAETGANGAGTSDERCGAAVAQLPLWRAALSSVAALALFAILDSRYPSHEWLAGAGFVAASLVPLAYWSSVARRRGYSLRDVMGGAPTWKHGRLVLLTTVTVLGVRFGWFAVLNRLDAMPEMRAAPRLWSSAAGHARSVLMLLAGVVLAPCAEEILCRGVLFRRLLRVMRPFPAAFISSVLFGLLHADLVGSTLLALALVVLYRQTRSLWVPIAAHALSNLAVVLVTWTQSMPAESLSNPWLVSSVVLVCSPWLVWFLQRGFRQLQSTAIAPSIAARVSS